MPKQLDDAITKCIRSMVRKGIDPKEAKSRCIGRFKNTGIVKKRKKGRGLNLTKKGREKFRLKKGIG